MKRGCRAGGFGPQERMTAAQAVDCHTAGLFESVMCRLKPGDLAGLVVVGRDIFAIDPLEIGAARVLLTMVGGEVACRRH